MISSRPEELYSGRNQKVRASVSLLEKIIVNDDVYKVWNEFR